MRKLALSVLITLPLLLAFACQKIEGTARDTSAALGGAIQSAQAQYLTKCIADPKGQACIVINQAVSAQNLLITATETYCGWSVGNPPPAGTTCVPVKAAEGALKTSIANADLFITELKGLLH